MANFLNYSNHPSSKWDAAQREAAREIGTVADLSFPAVPANSTEAEISALVDAETARILDLSPDAVLCQGEFTLCYAITARLLAHGIPVYAACSERCVTETRTPDGETAKQVMFRFVRFRKYEN